jgi:transposase InsO family protein
VSCGVGKGQAVVEDDQPRSHERWAHLRFSVVGGLLASPPAAGELRSELEHLAAKSWRHPTSGQVVRFGLSTIERWYYAALKVKNPVAALRRKLREDSGGFPAMPEALAQVLRQQYGEHPSWSCKLHLDNLATRVEADPALGRTPSYSTLRRFMAAHALQRQPRRRRERPGETAARQVRERREVRSFESEYTSGLWHLDFHHGSLAVLTKAGWLRPILLGILDDRSRLVCHAQWYLDETAESLVHGLIQAFIKRGLPRALMSDNGSAMTAAETTQGLARLSISHFTTLPYSPYQNGKQEAFWGGVEGRLMAMLEGERELSLALLNQATQAWIEMEYHRTVHSETNQPPLTRWLDGPSVGRESPTLEDLRLALTCEEGRSQRQGDGTISVEGTRFEVPVRFRHLRRVQVRYASWDLSSVWLVDKASGTPLTRIYPLDKARNSDGVRRVVDPQPLVQTVEPTGIAPLLRKLMSEYAATGLPPAYIVEEEE